MKRTSILAIGFSALLGFGVLAPGCGSDSDNGKKDSSVDTKKMDAAAPDGLKGTGGVLGGTGGALGTGGATVIAGSGGSTGAGGATTVPKDSGLDGPKLDVGSDRFSDGRDVSIAEGGPEVQNRDVALDQQLDKAPLLDVTVDSEPAGVDVGVGVDVGGVDSNID
jgi:hypothetical protein